MFLKSDHVTVNLLPAPVTESVISQRHAFKLGDGNKPCACSATAVSRSLRETARGNHCCHKPERCSCGNKRSSPLSPGALDPLLARPARAGLTPALESDGRRTATRAVRRESAAGSTRAGSPQAGPGHRMRMGAGRLGVHRFDPSFPPKSFCIKEAALTSERPGLSRRGHDTAHVKPYDVVMLQ